MIWLLLLLLLMSPCLSAGDQPIPPAKMQWMQSVMDDIYQMRFEDAARASRERITAEPEDPAGYVLLARTYWAQEMQRKHAFSISRFAAPDFFAEKQENKYKIRVDPAVAKRFLDTSQEAVQRAKAVLRKDSDNPEAMFLLGLAYQNEVTFHASTSGGWWDAFRAGQKTYRYHRRVHRAFPDFADPLLATGVYEYVAGSVPWSIRWLTFLIGSGGSRKKGLELLETATKQAELVDDDARTVLALIYARRKEYQASFDLLSELGDKYPENYLFQIDRATLARRLDRPQFAADILSELLRTIWDDPAKQPALERAEIYVQLGLAFRDMTNLRGAENWFRIALREPDISPHIRGVAESQLKRTLDEMQSQPPASGPVPVRSLTDR